MSIVQRSSKVFFALAAAGGLSAACSAAPPGPSESSEAASEALGTTVYRPNCPWYDHVECSNEGIHGQQLCYCMPNGTPTILEVALGDATGYALGYEGEIYTWGSGAHYARGDNSLADVSMLQKPLAPTPALRFAKPYQAAHVAAGDTGAAAVLKNGDVVAWGTVAPGTDLTVPTSIAGVTVDATKTMQLAHGANHACAISKTDSKTYCWGADDKGQLADATMVSRATAAPIPPYGTCGGHTQPIPPLTALAAGGDATCGLGMDGNVWCWGDNSHGALGQGAEAAGAYSATPECASVAFDSFSTATWIRGGGSGTFCAGTDNTYTDKTLCWGDNRFGQAGPGSNGPKDVPTPSVNMTISAPIQVFGKAHACIGGTLTSTTTASTVCFGDDSNGQLGTGPGGGATFSPVAPTFDQFTTLAAGGSFTCGVPTGSSFLKCWGKDDHGQVPDGATLPAPSNESVDAPTDAAWWD